jgi:hypothetical protein
VTSCRTALLRTVFTALVAAATAAPGALARPLTTPRLEALRVEAASPDGRCRATVLYPQVRGLGDARVAGLVNRYLTVAWRGQRDRELRRAVDECPSGYLASIGFQATLLPNGLLSVRQTRAVWRGDALPSSVEQTCHVLDLRRGKRLDLASTIGAEGRARIAAIARGILEQRYRTHDLRSVGFAQRELALAPGNFTVCLGESDLAVQIGAPHVVSPERGAIEVKVPLAAAGLAP